MKNFLTRFLIKLGLIGIPHLGFGLIITLIITVIIFIIMTLGNLGALLVIGGPTSSITYYNASNAYGMPFNVSKLRNGTSILDSKVEGFGFSKVLNLMSATCSNGYDRAYERMLKNPDYYSNGEKAMILINKKLNENLGNKDYMIHFIVSDKWYSEGSAKYFDIYNADNFVQNGKMVQLKLMRCSDHKTENIYLYDVVRDDKTREVLVLKNDSNDKNPKVLIRHRTDNFEEDVNNFLNKLFKNTVDGWILNSDFSLKEISLEKLLKAGNGNSELYDKYKNITNELGVKEDIETIQNLFGGIDFDNYTGEKNKTIINEINSILNGNYSEVFGRIKGLQTILKGNDETEVENFLKLFSKIETYKEGYNCSVTGKDYKKDFLKQKYLDINFETERMVSDVPDDEIGTCSINDIGKRFNCKTVGTKNLEKLNFYSKKFGYKEQNSVSSNIINNIYKCQIDDIDQDKKNNDNLDLYIKKLEAYGKYLDKEIKKTDNVIKGSNTFLDGMQYYDAVKKLLYTIDNENSFSLKQSYIIDMFNFVGLQGLKLGGTTSNQEILSKFLINLSWFNQKNLNKTGEEIYIKPIDFSYFGEEEAKEMLNFEADGEEDMYDFSFSLDNNDYGQGSYYNKGNKLKHPIKKVGNYYTSEDRKIPRGRMSDCPEMEIKMTKEELYTGKRVSRVCNRKCGKKEKGPCTYVQSYDVNPLISNASITYYKTFRFNDHNNKDSQGPVKRTDNRMNFFYETPQRIFMDSINGSDLSYIQNLHLDNKTIIFKGIFLNISSFGVTISDKGDIELIKDSDGQTLLKEAPIKFKLGFLTGLDEKYCEDFLDNGNCKISDFRKQAKNFAKYCSEKGDKKTICEKGNTTALSIASKNIIYERLKDSESYNSGIHQSKLHSDLNNLQFKIDYFNNLLEKESSRILEERVYNSNFNYILDKIFLKKKEADTPGELNDSGFDDLNKKEFIKPNHFTNFEYDIDGLFKKFLIFTSSESNYKGVDINEYDSLFWDDGLKNNIRQSVFDKCQGYKGLNNIYRTTIGLGRITTMVGGYDFPRYGNVLKEKGYQTSALFECYSNYFPYDDLGSYEKNGKIIEDTTNATNGNEFKILYEALKDKQWYLDLEEQYLKNTPKLQPNEIEGRYIRQNNYKKGSYEMFLFLFLLSEYNYNYINILYSNYLLHNGDNNPGATIKATYQNFIDTIQEPIDLEKNNGDKRYATYQDFIKGEYLKKTIGIEPFKYYSGYYKIDNDNDINPGFRKSKLSSFEKYNHKYRHDNLEAHTLLFYDLNRSFDFSEKFYTEIDGEGYHKITVNPNLYLLAFINNVKENENYVLDFYGNQNLLRYSATANKQSIDKNALFTMFDFFNKGILYETTKPLRKKNGYLGPEDKIITKDIENLIEIINVNYKRMLLEYLTAQKLFDGKISENIFTNSNILIDKGYLDKIIDKGTRRDKKYYTSFLGLIKIIGKLNYNERNSITGYYNRTPSVLANFFLGIKDYDNLERHKVTELYKYSDRLTENSILDLYNCEKDNNNSYDTRTKEDIERCEYFGGSRPRASNIFGNNEYTYNIQIAGKIMKFFREELIRQGRIIYTSEYFDEDGKQSFMLKENIEKNQKVINIVNYPETNQEKKDGTKLYNLLYKDLYSGKPEDSFVNNIEKIKEIINDETIDYKDATETSLFNLLKDKFFSRVNLSYNDYVSYRLFINRQFEIYKYGYNGSNTDNYSVFEKYFYSIPFVLKSDQNLDLDDTLRFTKQFELDKDGLLKDNILFKKLSKNFTYYKSYDDNLVYKNHNIEKYTFLNNKLSDKNKGLKEIIDNNDNIKDKNLFKFNYLMIDAFDNNRKNFIGILEMLDALGKYTDKTDNLNQNVSDYGNIDVLDPFYFIYIQNNLATNFYFNLQEVNGNGGYSNSNFLGGYDFSEGDFGGNYDTILGRKIKKEINKNLDKLIQQYRKKLDTEKLSGVEQEQILKKIQAIELYKGYDYASYLSELDMLLTFVLEKDYRTHGVKQFEKELQYPFVNYAMPGESLIGTVYKSDVIKDKSIQKILDDRYKIHRSNSRGRTGNCTWYANLLLQFPYNGGNGKDYGTAFPADKYPRTAITYGMSNEEKMKKLRVGAVISFPDYARGCKPNFGKGIGHVAVIIGKDDAKQTYTLAEMNLSKAYSVSAVTRHISTICRATIATGFQKKHVD